MVLPRPLLVALGAVAGAGLRWSVDTVVGGTAGLLIVNSGGTIVLGALLAGARAPRESTQLLVGVGFCGALTTFSTLAVDVATRLDNGDIAAGIGVLATGVGLGVIALGIGSGLRRMRP